MPVLNWNPNPRKLHPRAHPYHPAAAGRVAVEILPAPRELVLEPPPRPRFFETCANPHCGSRWLKLWRSRRMPLFEDARSCSLACMRAMIASALSREMHWRPPAPEAHRHRIPLGLAMLEQGWITAAQLRAGLEAQKAAGSGRLGQWLVRQRAASEEQVTRALGLQWSSPVLSLGHHDAEALSALVPRLFIDAFGALPLRVAAGKILYLGFEDRPDPVLALAIERMTRLRVESGLVQDSLFRRAHTRMLSAFYPRTRLVEASSETAVLDALLQAMEQESPAEACLVRVHDCLWMRLWKRPQLHRRSPKRDSVASSARDSIVDLICSATEH